VRKSLAKRVNLSEHIPFLLYRLASRLSIEANAQFKALEVNTFSSRVLFVLLSQQAMTVGELSTITSIDQSTLSHILIRLDRQGFTTKRREGRDSRTVTVGLTAKGREFAQRCHDISLTFARVTTASMNADQKNELRRMLKEMYRNLTTSNRVEDRRGRKM
jgi:MarR family transcriptional regulator, organic hydroperoxide resistance regulator